LVGEREVTLEGEVVSAAEAHAALGLEPLTLQPKESLAVMNGTSVMTGLACLAFERARALAALASSITAMTSQALHGNPEHFDDRIFALKPHPGQRACAAFIHDHLADRPERKVARLQDRYSVRCAPHVIGVLVDALAPGRVTLEIELNSVNDNPIIDVAGGEVLHGGNFYGGHVCFVMDGLKNAIANVADLLDRQLALLCCPDTSDGLPENLIAGRGPERLAHHGFKAVQISASALTAEALKLTMPASVFSRSTESHNQDKVSMGTIAARDCLRVLELVESVAAMVLLADCQAVDLRGAGSFSSRTRRLYAFIRRGVPKVEIDRRQDLDIQHVLDLQRAGKLPGVGRGEPLDPSRLESSRAEPRGA
jgi:histidine ammonia-lyase